MTEPQKTQKNPHKKLIIISVIIMFVFINVMDYLFIGNIAYLVKWRECGSRPYVVVQPVNIGFGAGPPETYWPYVERNPSIIDGKQPLLLDLGHATMFCSLDDIKQLYGEKYRLS